MAFADEVEEARHQWPANADGVWWTKGRGYVTESVPVKAHAERVAAAAAEDGLTVTG